MTVLCISCSIPKLFPSNKIQYLAFLSPRKQLKEHSSRHSAFPFLFCSGAVKMIDFFSFH